MKCKLKDFCTVINGRAYSQKELLDKGKYRVLRVGNFFSSDRWYFSDLELPAEKYCNKGDLLFAWACSFGPRIWNGEDRTIFHYHIWKLDIDSNIVDKMYLFYLLKISVDSMTAGTHGSVMMHITKSDMENFEFDIPTLEVQKKIAAILSALDEKIAINRAINDNLQQQAFSVFDNLIANTENNDCTVFDYAFLNPKRTLAKNQVARSIDMSQLSTSGAFPSGWEMKPFNGGMRFTNGDTLLARITPCLENGKTAFIDFLDDGEVAFGSTEYIVLAPKNDTPPEMLYCLARYPAFVDYAVKNMNGSSGRQRVSAETVGQYRLPLFDKHSLVLFREVVSPMFLKMRYNSLENMRLAELQDALLPKLMSGEIDVSAIQL